jgi:hypothetical protein
MTDIDTEISEHRFCTVHNSNLNYRDCEMCNGEGGYHDCGEDCCCCDDPKEPNRLCKHCRGTGIIEWCPDWTHKKSCSPKDWTTYKNYFEEKRLINENLQTVI